MFFFVLRRFLVSIPIMLASSFVLFFLVTIAGDPLASIRQSQNPNREQRMATIRNLLELDRPFPQRYWSWLNGLFRFDFGKNREGQDVSALLGQAIQNTLRLVVLATVFSVILGLLFGIITAVRQYSPIDYGSTFAAFLFFSLPVFWLAVMLKEFGAIKFNDFLEDPGLSGGGIVLLTVISTAFVMGLTIGSWRRRALAGIGAATASIVGLLIIDGTGWMENPGFSPIALVILAGGTGVFASLLFAPLADVRVVASGVIAAGAAIVGSATWSSWVNEPNWTRLLILLLLTIGTGIAVGTIVGGPIDRRSAISAAVTTTCAIAVLVMFDEFISAWSPGRTIGTIGPQSPNLNAPFWERMVDYAGHQILPSLSLALIGFATFMRFTRSSMLDTLKSDYVRTAKAKGLPPVQVIMRHAFRTALIPVMTVVTISFATIIEGAVITERVFAWKGMGTLFITGLSGDLDPYPVMGFLVIVSISIVLLNAVADVMYAYLDPRVRR